MAEVISSSTQPVLLLDLPSTAILACSESARRLLALDGDEQVRGARLSELTELTAGSDYGSANLLLQGRLNGYQSRLRRSFAGGSEDLTLWTRAVIESDPTAPVLAMLAPGDTAERWAVQEAELPTPMIIGSADKQLSIDRMSDEITGFLGYAPEDVLGRSLLGLIGPEDLPNLLFGLAQATMTQQGISLAARLLRPDHTRARCQLVILPLSPTPSVAFAIQPAQLFLSERRTGKDLGMLLRRFIEGILAAGAARELTSYDSALRPVLPELTSREMQIVSRLLAGDRVPAISQQLYLAQSTVRNHLSAVFAKFGVRSQQELIVLLRTAQARNR
jgi:DNA-binding NarL/FixJ family response regulator